MKGALGSVVKERKRLGESKTEVETENPVWSSSKCKFRPNDRHPKTPILSTMDVCKVNHEAALVLEQPFVKVTASF